MTGHDMTLVVVQLTHIIMSFSHSRHSSYNVNTSNDTAQQSISLNGHFTIIIVCSGPFWIVSEYYNSKQ